MLNGNLLGSGIMIPGGGGGGGGGGGRFKNTHELLNLHLLIKSTSFGLDILHGISNVPFEIPHKISYPYIGRYGFYTTLKF